METLLTRELDWPHCLNARDLGGMPTVGGGRTRRGAVVRSDHPAHLTAAGWVRVWDFGIRTVVSVETNCSDRARFPHYNHRIDATVHLPGVAVRRVAIEDADDAEFTATWSQNFLWGTPVYYREALRRWPERHARAVAAVADAPEGGVLVHCNRGCDRTGLLSILLLAAVGVEPAEIAEDYALSGPRLAPREPGEHEAVLELLAGLGTSPTQGVLDLLTEFDIPAYLADAGVTEAQFAALRARLLEP